MNIYSLSPLLKKTLISTIILGFFLFSIGLYKNLLIDESKLKNFIYEHPDRFDKGYIENLDQKKIDHFMHQAHNRPWSALYVAVFYFLGLSLGVLFFLCIQHVAQAGWSMILTRLMEGIASFLPYGGIALFLILLFNVGGFIHMFHWMDPSLYDKESLSFDPILNNKRPFLNSLFFLSRSFLYILGWSFFMFWIKKTAKKLNQSGDIKYHRKLYNVSVGFIIFFAISSMIMGWDWVMSLDPHWFSTLFGWYILGSYLTSGISLLALICIYLKNKGCFPLFKKDHQHDLGKYMFATSLLWTYLWFAQFLLYWYGNIPEEVVYFLDRAKQYKNLHFWMLIPNFLLPLLGLMGSDIKRKSKVIVSMGVIILIGHYIDFYHMIMPGSVGGFFGFGWVELGSLLFVGGGFLWIVLHAIGKDSLVAKGSPLFKESEDYEYPY